MMKKFKILEELPKCDTEIQSEQKMLEKMVLMDLLNAKLLPTFHLLKKKKKKAVSGKCNKTKHNKTRYACSKYRQKIQREI